MLCVFGENTNTLVTWLYYYYFSDFFLPCLLLLEEEISLIELFHTQNAIQKDSIDTFNSTLKTFKRIDNRYSINQTSWPVFLR